MNLYYTCHKGGVELEKYDLKLLKPKAIKEVKVSSKRENSTLFNYQII